MMTKTTGKYKKLSNCKQNFALLILKEVYLSNQRSDDKEHRKSFL